VFYAAEMLPLLLFAAAATPLQLLRNTKTEPDFSIKINMEPGTVSFFFCFLRFLLINT
jgi:hypothetical protein